jgi:hypothetical protein
MPICIKLFLAYYVYSPIIYHIHCFDLLCLMISFKIQKAVELSVYSGVTGCLCPSSIKVTLSSHTKFDIIVKVSGYDPVGQQLVHFKSVCDIGL